MKIGFFIELCVLTVLVILCIFRTRKSSRPIVPAVMRVLFSVLMPLAGNMILTLSGDPLPCTIGYTLFFCGTNLLLFALMEFSLEYCGFPPMGRKRRGVLAGVLTADSVSILLNLFTHHMFGLRRTVLSGENIYYAIAPHAGYMVHIALSALIILMILGTFVYRLRGLPLMYAERYLILLIAFAACAVWEYSYLITNRPMDRSMVGYGVGALLVFAFAILYRPFYVQYALHDLVVGNLEDAVVFFDQEGEPIYANTAAERMFGIVDDNVYDSMRLLRPLLEEDDLVREEFEENRTIEREDGTAWYTVKLCRLQDKRGRSVGSFFSIRDYSEEEREAQARRYSQTHDLLTGLSNKESFIAQVEQRMKEQPDTAYVMLLSDISDFKMINDVYGRETADRLLQEFADAVRRAVSPDTLSCRWGGDQFAALVRKELISPEWVSHAIADQMRQAKGFRDPIVMHIGYYEVESADMPVTGMIDRCRLAIASIKHDYQKVVGVYDESLRQERLWEQKVIRELPGAIRKGQILPYMQPQYDGNGKLIGAECLVRWIHPKEGFLAPYRFIPILEKNGMIAQVDRHIWEEACRKLASWKGTEREGLHLSVNISPKDFYFMDIYGIFTGLVEKYGLDPGQLHLEITETVVMQDSRRNIADINRLRAYGFLVEMDDFGSGYSSLNLLRDMPVDVLKIDMAFLGRTSQPKKAEAILRNIIALSRQLGLISIAEGVELSEQLHMLSEMGCGIFQGYFFAKPMSPEEFEQLSA